jgi:hypothetical protein
MMSRTASLAFAGSVVLAGALASISAGQQGNLAQPPADSSAQSAADASVLRFSGEVTRGQPFTRDVGHGLFFRLTPATSDEGGGWVIEILPPIEPAKDPGEAGDPAPPGDAIEFSAIATPPYHAYNDRYIAAAFGYTSKEALSTPLRKFNFVESVEDQQRASDVVNAALYPSIVGEAERARVAAEARQIMLGAGQVRIVHSKITSGKDGSPDVIAWIKFDVELNFSPGLTLQQVLAPHPPAAKK